ncbi:unnamed protein product [Arabidopsis halleri]
MGGTRIIGVFLSRLLAKMDMVVIFAAPFEVFNLSRS